MQTDSLDVAASPVPVTIPAQVLSALPVLKQSLYPKRNGTAILNSVLIYFDGRVFAARTTDLDTETVYKYTFAERVVDAMPFTVAIPFAAFARAIDEAKQVTLAVAGVSAIVTADGAVTSIPVLPALDFPPPARLKFGAVLHSATVPMTAFVQALRRASNVACTDSTRGAVLMGSLIEFGPAPSTMRLATTQPGISVTATDGFRFVQAFTPATVLSAEPDPKAGTDSDTPQSIVAPSTFADALRKVSIAKGAGDVNATLTVSARYIRFVGGNYTIIAQRVDGQYPNYHHVAPPASVADAFTVDRKAFIEAVKAAPRVLTGKTRKVILAQTGTDLTVTACSDNGDFTKHVEVTSSRESFTTAFNGADLADLLTLFSADRVTLEQTDPLRPVTILEASHASSVMALMMPLRL